MLKKVKIAVYLFLSIALSNLHADPFIEGLVLSNKEISPFKAPSIRQFDKEGADHIRNSLYKSGSNPKYWDWWNQVICHEERGIFGYHGAKQQFRIFQDIIKMIFLEVLELEIPRDFHFLRIPLDPDLFESESAAVYLKKRPDPFDGLSPDRDQLVSLNYSLFGNYWEWSQCTVGYFSKNQSWFEIFYAKKLEFLFLQLGMPISEINNLMRIGDPIVKFETGVIYQFVDLSHQSPNDHDAYELVDRLCYQSVGAGKVDPFIQEQLSSLFQSTLPRKFDHNGGGQLRIIMNTSESLNPYNSIYMRRYDLLDPIVVKNYEHALRERVRKLPFDSEKVEIYKEKLKALWGIQDG
jgi:hypothetical protein